MSSQENRGWVKVSLNSLEQQWLDEQMIKRGFTKRSSFVKWALTQFFLRANTGEVE